MSDISTFHAPATTATNDESASVEEEASMVAGSARDQGATVACTETMFGAHLFETWPGGGPSRLPARVTHV